RTMGVLPMVAAMSSYRLMGGLPGSGGTTGAARDGREMLPVRGWRHSFRIAADSRRVAGRGSGGGGDAVDLQQQLPAADFAVKEEHRLGGDAGSGEGGAQHGQVSRMAQVGLQADAGTGTQPLAEAR